MSALQILLTSAVVVGFLFGYLLHEPTSEFSQDSVESNNRILVGNYENIKSLTARGRSLVLFWAGWCGYCTRFKPDFARLSNMPELSSWNFISVNAMENQQLVSKYGVDGYPTLLEFKDGLYMGAYTESRSLGAMKRYLQAK